jgi:O-antigen/teichoic acid export membrane protein
MLCIAGALMPISFLFSNLLISQGHSSAYMWITISQILAQLLAVGLSVPYGMNRMVLTFVVINILWVLIWFLFAHKGICMSTYEAILDVSPYFVLSLASIAISYYTTLGITNIYLALFSKIAIAVAVYCIALWLLGSTIFKETIHFIVKKEIL